MTRLAMIETADLEVLVDAAAEWLKREDRYSPPPGQRQRATRASKERDAVRGAIERHKAKQRLGFG